MTTEIPESAVAEPAPVWETGIELPGIVPLLAPTRLTLAVLAALQVPAPVPEIAAHADLPSTVTLRHLRHLARLGLAAPDKADPTRYQTGPGRCPVRPALLSVRGRTAVIAWRLESTGQAARILGAEVLPSGEQILPDPDRPPHIPADRGEALAWFTGEREALASDVESAYELGQDHLAWRLALLVLGLTCFTGPWDGWRGIYECGLAAARRGQHRPAQAMFEELAGKLELTAGNRAAALEHQQHALTMRATAGDLLGVLRSLNAIGLIFLREQAWREAGELFDWALEMAGNLGDEQFETFALLNLGAVHAAEGQHARAAAELDRAIARLRAAGRDPYIANALQDLALACHRAGDLERAAQVAEDGVEAAVSAGIPMFLPGPLIESARIQARRGHLRVALALLHEAHGIYAEIGDEVRTARTLAEIEATARTAAAHTLPESTDPAAAQARQ